VTQSNANHLRLYTEQLSSVPAPETLPLVSLPAVLSAFQHATGWHLRYSPAEAGAAPRAPGLPSSNPANLGKGFTPGQLILEVGRPARAGRLDAQRVEPLAESLAALVGETMQAQHALWLREAELAAGVPLVPTSDGPEHLATRLEAVLKAGARAVGCNAAALYLLDEATSQLKLRACWGMPRARLLDDARPLRGATADLEALLGSAVVLNDPELIKLWKSPEQCPTAVCVPVSTPTTILGTLWFFADKRREFADRQTAMLEIVAGRVAADLEREVLVREGIEAARLKRQVAQAEQYQRDQLPAVAPQIDGWDIAGWTAASGCLTGDFHDWFAAPDGRTTLMLGSAAGNPLEAALFSSGLKTALRCHAEHVAGPADVLRRVNTTLWTASTGGQQAAALCAVAQPHAGRIELATAGRIGVVLSQGPLFEVHSQALPPLGESADLVVPPREIQLLPGQSLLLASPGLLTATDAENRTFGETGLGQAIAAHAGQPAARLAMHVQDHFDAHRGTPPHNDATLIVLTRRK